MNRVILALVMLGMATGAAMAQNPYDLTGGVFILHAPPGLSYSLDPPADGWCGSPWMTDCAGQVNTIPSVDDPADPVWYILSSFYETKAFKAIEYGIVYAPALFLYAAGMLCTPSAALTIEYPWTGAWPSAGSGISIALTGEPYWTGSMVASGMIHGVHYSYMDPTTITLAPMPASSMIGWLSPNGQTYSPACVGVLGIDMPGVACCSAAPPVSHACCFADGRCEVLLDEACAAAGGVVYPDHLACETNPCPQPPRACCFEDGHCEILPATDCLAQSGVVYPDPDCDPNPCLVPLQACCFATTCQELTPADCAAQGGVVYPDPDCDPNPCPVPPQACCFGETCQMLTPADCTAQGGVIYPDPDCDPNPCPPPVPEQACCFGHACALRTPDDCMAHGGVVYPESSCFPNPCPSEPQACCLGTDCVVLLPDDCSAEGGVSYPYPDCDPNPCPILPQECSAGGAPSGLQDQLTGGVFILHAPPGLSYSSDPPAGGWFDEMYWGIDCASQANDIPADDESEWIWYILSQFYESKRFRAVEYGIVYDVDLYLHASSELCTPSTALTIEYPATGAWPAAGSAIAIALQSEPYWWGTLSATGMIHGWHYTYMAPGTITLGPSGSTGFIGWLSGGGEGYAPECIGALGLGTPGVPCCSQIPSEPQACCFGPSCVELSLSDCQAQGGIVYPDPDCDPNPCPLTPQECSTGSVPSGSQDDLTGGVFILHAPPGLAFSNDPPAGGWFSETLWGTDCEGQVNGLPADDENEWVWYILSQFYLSKRFQAVEYGIVYDADAYMGAVSELCTPSEALTIEYPATGAWPSSGSAIAIALQGEPYWRGTLSTTGTIHGWHYTHMAPGTITLGPSPATGFIGWLSGSGEGYAPACVGVLGLGMPGVPCCAENPSQPQACCFGPECQLMPPSLCEAQGGVVYPDSDCDPNPCPYTPLACCLDDGVCVNVFLQAECEGLGGTFHPEANCETPGFTCPLPIVWACCYAEDENCYMQTEEDCLANNGTWHEGVDCANFSCLPGPAVCCVQEVCHLTTLERCEELGGIWYSEWRSCDPNPCFVIPTLPSSWGGIKALYR
jgi:hypothetical protein